MNRRAQAVVDDKEDVYAMELLDAASATDRYDEAIADVQLRHVTATAGDRLLKCSVSPRRRVLLASAAAAIGGVLFGYDTGVISGALLQLRAEFNLNCQQTELVVSALLIGALIASLFGGFLVDFCGRKETIVINDVIFLLGTIMLSAAHNFVLLVFGRLIVGFAVSLSATAECIYIAEISPPKRRGQLVSLNELGITVGFLLAYICNSLFISVPSGWRYMFAVGALLSIIQAAGVLVMPPSPRYYVLRGKYAEARRVLQSLLDVDDDVDVEFNLIKNALQQEQSQTCRDVCCGQDDISRQFLIAIALTLLQQLTGQATMLSYAPMIFQQVGFHSDTAAVFATVGLGVVKVLMTCVYLLITGKFGRRTLLLVGSTLMLVGTICLGALIHAVFHDPVIAASCRAVSNITTPVDDKYDTATGNDVTMTSRWAWLSLVSMLTVISGYSIGFGPGTWLLLSEMFPAYIKGRAVAVATCFNWATNLIVSVTFLDFISAVGTSTVFWLYATASLLSIIFIAVFVPETKDKNLEQINEAISVQQQRVLRLFRCCSPGGNTSTRQMSQSAVLTASYERVLVD